MTSRLFHTVVAVGISLGAVACAQGAPEETVTDDSALSAEGASGRDAIEAAFCDAPWPTTKGAHLWPAPACIDPEGECSTPPTLRCVTATADRVCTSWPDFYPVCNDGVWECAPGKIPQSECRCWQWGTGDQTTTTCEDDDPVARRQKPAAPN